MSCRAFRKLGESLAGCLLTNLSTCYAAQQGVPPLSLCVSLCVLLAQITSAEAGTAAAKFARRSTVARRVTTSERCH